MRAFLKTMHISISISALAVLFSAFPRCGYGAHVLSNSNVTSVAQFPGPEKMRSEGGAHTGVAKKSFAIDPAGVTQVDADTPSVMGLASEEPSHGGHMKMVRSVLKGAKDKARRTLGHIAGITKHGMDDLGRPLNANEFQAENDADSAASIHNHAAVSHVVPSDAQSGTLSTPGWFPTHASLSQALVEDREDPSTWLFIDGSRYYINLPDDNWCDYAPLHMTWKKLRLTEAPTVGMTSVTINTHDYAYAENNGQTSNAHNLKNLEWGIAADCREGGLQSGMKINLRGTPFGFPSPVPVNPAGYQPHGSITCSADHQSCEGQCGGRCGYCGLGPGGQTATAELQIVDQTLFDHALTTTTTTIEASTTKIITIKAAACRGAMGILLSMVASVSSMLIVGC